MGKYMKKVSSSSSSAAIISWEVVGVLTRAKRVALEQQQQQQSEEEDSYLQLRSRRLQKPNRRKRRIIINPKTKNKQRPNQTTTSRRTRETTPCDLIISSDNVKLPASTVKQRRTPITNQTTLTAPSTTREMEDLLARMEHSNNQDQHRFIQRYNFDVVNDKPLPGRYEWEAISPEA